jgi:hypothetical protein
MAHEPRLLHHHLLSAVVCPNPDWSWSPLHCGPDSRHQQVTHYRKYHVVPWSWPSGPHTGQHHNRDGVDGFRMGARSGHRTHTRITHTLDTAGSAKPMLYPSLSRLKECKCPCPTSTLPRNPHCNACAADEIAILPSAPTPGPSPPNNNSMCLRPSILDPPPTTSAAPIPPLPCNARTSDGIAILPSVAPPPPRSRQQCNVSMP